MSDLTLTDEPPVEIEEWNTGSKYDKYVDLWKSYLEENKGIGDETRKYQEETFDEQEVQSLRDRTYDRVDREEFEYQVRSRQTKKDDDQYVVWIQHDEPNEEDE